MEFQIRRIPYTHGMKSESDVMIEPLSDIHVGARFHDKAKFAEVVNRIAQDPRRYTFIMGDVFDATFPDNKFYDEASRDPELPTLQSQYDYVYRLLKPISHKILGVHCGNHDERIRKQHWQDKVHELCIDLQIPPPEFGTSNARVGYLGYMAISRLVFVSEGQQTDSPRTDSFDFLTAHGGYSGRRVGGNMNSNEDIANSFGADVYLTGHTHQLAVHKKVKVGMDKAGRLVEYVKMFGVCGSFARAYNEGFTTYPEYKIMSSSRVGTITIGVNPREGKLHGYE